MKNLICMLLLFVFSVAYGQTHIGDLPLGSAATSASSDSFPYQVSGGHTQRLTLYDIINLPPLQSEFATLAQFASGTQAGQVSTSTQTFGGAKTFNAALTLKGDVTFDEGANATIQTKNDSAGTYNITVQAGTSSGSFGGDIFLFGGQGNTDDGGNAYISGGAGLGGGNGGNTNINSGAAVGGGSPGNIVMTPAAGGIIQLILSSGANVAIVGGSLDLSSHNITSVADPVNAQDAATKNYCTNASHLSSGTTGVSVGGTGANSFTAYQPIIGGTTSTGPLASVSTGGASVGYVLTYQGTSSPPTWQAGSSTPTGGHGYVAMFDPSSGNLTDSNAVNGSTLTFSTATGALQVVGPSGHTQSSISLAGSGGGNMGFKGPSGTGANVLWTLPAADGSAGQLLGTDSAGNLGWYSGGGTMIGASSKSSSQQSCNSSTVVFANTTDTGSFISGNTFVAPHTGWFNISASIVCENNSANTYAYIEADINSSNYAHNTMMLGSGGVAYSSVNLSFAKKLTASDVVSFICICSATSAAIADTWASITGL